VNKDQIAITRDGVSQAERWFDSLVPAYIQLDSRETPDLLDFLFELSKKIKHYNDQNIISGNWEDFFTSDPNFLIILFSRIEMSEVNIRYTEKKENILKANTIFEAEKALREYLIFINDYYSKMNIALRRFEDDANTPDFETMVYLLGGNYAIGNVVYSYYTQAIRLFSDVYSVQLENGIKNFNGSLTNENSYFDLNNVYPLEIITGSLFYLNDAFEQLLSRLARVVKASKEFVIERKYLDRQYQPQTALFLTFLELYGYARKRLNGLVGKHLDYYYQQILDIKLEDRQPDFVHVVAELEEQAPSTNIGANDLLLAKLEGKDEEVYYKPERNLVLSRAKINSIKTIFLSDYKQIEATSKNHRDIKEIQVFKTEQSLFNPIDYLKKTNQTPVWAIMGEDQHELAESERTMQEADIGIAIVSPLFYQVEGNRKFTITIELRSTELLGLDRYLTNYALAKNASRETAEHKLFSNAFNLFYSSMDGWVEVKNHSSKIFDSDKEISKLVVTFYLNNSDPSFDCYDENIHKEFFNVNQPVLKLMLDSDVEHNAYSFLRHIQLNRITINVNVKGFRAVKLQNNVGQLSIAAPFQPFGPQPAVGSFLDIKNSNVFNLYLKDFNVKLNWLELPIGKGGLRTYYDGYGVKLENDSFKVNLSSLSEGKYTPTKSIRQEFNLFNDDTETEELLEQSILSNIDFKKVNFQNEPQLKKETKFNEDFFREGAIRIELCAPDEAFGHKLFPQVFPKVILNNSKRFNRKLPLPNQPFIPIIKTIELDYDLEYSEGFKESQSGSQHFQLFHLYPFGFQNIFPGAQKKNYWFMPRIDSNSNLIIGLNNVDAKTELSLFFQMEERGFHHSLHEPDPVIWSYLEDNTWVEFKPSSIVTKTTGDFVNSGIVCLRMPSNISTKNTILPEGVFWIKASSNERHGISGRVKSIMVNGFIASRVLGVNDSKYNLLEPNRIKGFAKTVRGVQSVFQLYPSFGGNAAETKENYYLRTSERLRHKNRYVQIRDINQAILKQFPSILIVKSFNSRREKFTVVPGIDLHIVLIPREVSVDKLHSEQPAVSLSELYKVKSFVSSIISPFVKIEVGNAVYERVKVLCKVLFHSNQDADDNILRRRFISDVNKYIAPWLHGDSAKINIGSKIHRAEFLIYLKNLSYVKYVGGFSVVHFTSENKTDTDDLSNSFSDSAFKSFDVIQGSTPASVLIPSPFHIVEIISDMGAEMPQKSGIGNLIIGEEFLVMQQKIENSKGSSNIDDDEAFGIIISHNID